MNQGRKAAKVPLSWPLLRTTDFSPLQDHLPIGHIKCVLEWSTPGWRGKEGRQLISPLLCPMV